MSIGRKSPVGFNERILHDIGGIDASSESRIEPELNHAMKSVSMPSEQCRGRRVFASGDTVQ